MNTTLAPTVNTCPHEYCALNHPDGGGVCDDTGTWWWIHTSRHPFGAVWENVVTGALVRRVDFDHYPTPTQLRLAADWLEVG